MQLRALVWRATESNWEIAVKTVRLLFVPLVLGVATLTACAQPVLVPPPAQQQLPGRHPGYLHALSDLRAARWYLFHQPGDAGVYVHEDMAISEIDAAIGAIKHAAIDDGKDLHYHPGVDAPERGSRLLKAIETLRQARADVSGEEDNPEVRELRHRAVEHIERALVEAERAHADWIASHR